VRAVKPLCSGGREDAQALRRAQGDEPGLDDLNPWDFQEPLAPVLAARRMNRKVVKRDVLEYLRQSARRCDVLLVEGAGGLLSPLGEDFDGLDLLRELKACPIVVAVNRLGAVNQIRLVLAVLPARIRIRAMVVLMTPARLDRAARSNAKLLEEFAPGVRLVSFPRVDWPAVLEVRLPANVRRALNRLINEIDR
jgi:dethiobiotin synthetase